MLCRKGTAPIRSVAWQQLLRKRLHMRYAVQRKRQRCFIDLARLRQQSLLKAQFLRFFKPEGHMGGRADGTRQADFTEVDVVLRKSNT